LAKKTKNSNQKKNYCQFELESMNQMGSLGLKLKLKLETIDFRERQMMQQHRPVKTIVVHWLESNMNFQIGLHRRERLEWLRNHMDA